MTNLFYLTILGSILTILLILFKNSLIKKYGGIWYYYIWIVVLICYCVPYKIDIMQWFAASKIQQEYNNFYPNITLTNDINIDIKTNENHYENNKITEQYHKNLQHSISKKQLLCVIYFIGFFILLLYYCYHYIIFQKNLKNNTTYITNEDYINCMNAILSEMKITDKIILKKSNSFHSPIFIGILNPTIILPNINFDITELSMILKHELMHHKRNDMIYRLFAIIVHMIHWFNPICYITLCSINEACEYSCDEMVTQNMNTENKIQYGNMLLNQIQYHTKKCLFSAKLLENNKNILKRRIDIIMNNKKYNRIKISLLFLFVAILCSNFFNFYKINADNSNKNTATINTTQKTIYNTETIYQNLAKTLTQHQLKHIYKFIEEVEEKASNNISTQTRTLTYSEQQRYSLLRHKYIIEGIRPQNSIAMEAGKQELYINFYNRMYHYPERELTDEEILQLIEWDFIQEYANTIKYQQHYTSLPNIDNITEEEAIQTAKQNVENLFDVDTTNLQINANFYKNSNIQPDGWFIRLYPEGDRPYELNWNYAVWITQETIEIARSSQTYPYEIITEKDVITILNDKSWFDVAKSILEQKQFKTDIASIDFINMENINKKNRVDIKATTNSGYSYVISLYYPDKTLKSISMPYQKP